MVIEKPTAGRRATPISISSEHQTLIRGSIEVWRDGVQEDLENAHLRPLRDPDVARRLAATYGRLLEALDTGRLWLPDQEARRALEEAENANPAEGSKTIALDNTNRALLALFDRAEEDADLGAPMTRDEDLAMEWALLQRVLDVHPARVTVAELRREIVGGDADFGDSRCGGASRSRPRRRRPRPTTGKNSSLRRGRRFGTWS